jgi:SnoaL-like domain
LIEGNAHLIVRVALVLLCAMVASASHSSPVRDQRAALSSRRLVPAEFKTLMRTVAQGWNENDARRAAECFTEDAKYSAPPNPRIRESRKALYEFFGGPTGRPRAMRMEWHHLLFDEETQIGAGEYTFEYEIRTHGIVIVRIVNGLIANWREYEHESPLSWKEMVGANSF